ncbi:MAG: hypothetical protein KJO85_06480, partial [Gammaproteobacteria bacterium]|nr:hypothetical protein [Gammaproteobacteria bacterium]
VSNEGARLFSWDAEMPFPVLLGVLFAGSMKLIVEPRQISRFFALRDRASIRQGIWVAVAGIVIIQFCLLPIGIYAHLFISEVQDTDLVVPMLVASPMFPDVLAAFLVLAMVAAAMSSLDSVLLVAASTMERDVVSSFFPRLTEHANVNLTRILVVIISVVTALIALRPPGGIIQLTIFSGSMYAACFFPALIIGLHWHRGNGVSAAASILTGITVLLIWTAAGWNAKLHEVFPALLLSTVVFVLLGWLTTPNNDPRVQQSFSRADAGPG